MKNKYFFNIKKIILNLGKDTCQRIFIMAKWFTSMYNIWENGNLEGGAQNFELAPVVKIASYNTALSRSLLWERERERASESFRTLSHSLSLTCSRSLSRSFLQSLFRSFSISIWHCQTWSLAPLASKVATVQDFLGRPWWKEYKVKHCA